MRSCRIRLASKGLTGTPFTHGELPETYLAPMGHRRRYRTDHAHILTADRDGAPRLSCDLPGGPHGGIFISVFEHDDAAFLLPVQQPGNELQSFVHGFTRLPGHSALPAKGPIV